MKPPATAAALPEKNDLLRKVLWAISNILWAYIIYRAVVAEVTIDEANSYYMVKTNQVADLFQNANNHWLNSLFMKIGIWLPGEDAPWKLRLFSLLSWPLYSFATIQLVMLFRSRLLGIAFFAMAIVNPYIIIFFSLARGYSGGCAFLLLSIWAALKAIRKEETTSAEKWIPATMYAALAVLSNFSFFYFFVALVGTLVVHLLFNKSLKTLFAGRGKRLLLLVVAITIFSMVVLIIMNQSKTLYFGGDDLVRSLVGSLFMTSAYYDISPILQDTMNTIFVIMLAAFLISAILYIRSRKLTFSALIMGLGVGIIAFNYILFWLFKTPFLMERTALCFYFPLILSVPGMLDDIGDSWKRFTWVKYAFHTWVAWYLVSTFYINFMRSIDVEHLNAWRTDLGKCLEGAQAEGAKNVALTPSNYEMFCNYYLNAYPEKYSFKYNLMQYADQGKPLDSIRDMGYDHMIISVNSPDELKLRDSFDVKRYYDFSHMALLKVK